MASNPEFVQYIADQLAPAGQVTYHKMFGDYGVYLDGKMFALVCDDQLFIKITKEGAALAPQLPKAPPYDGHTGVCKVSSGCWNRSIYDSHIHDQQRPQVCSTYLQ